MRSGLLILLTALLGVGAISATVGFAQTTPSHRPTCLPPDGRTPLDLIVTACNELIRAGQTTGDALFRAHMNRAKASFGLADYSQALLDYTKALELDPKSAAAMAARGETHVRNLDWESAMADFDKAVALDPEYAPPYFTRGVLRYNAANFPGAADDFARFVALTAKRPEPYGALWLFLARTRTKDANANAELRSNPAAPTAGPWPAPVTAFFLGRTTPEMLLAAATERGQRCEANFYAGAWHAARGEYAKARPTLTAAVSDCPKIYLEYDAARAELRRLAP